MQNIISFVLTEDNVYEYVIPCTPVTVHLYNANLSLVEVYKLV